MLNTYRLRQFWNAFTATPDKKDLILVGEYLSPHLLALFMQMQKSEQKHSILVFKDLLEQGEKDQDLLTAALLHDVGKTLHPLNPIERAIIVLGTALLPEKVKTWEKSPPKGWKRLFVVAKKHPEWGAKLALEAGASPRTATIIRRHHEIIYQINKPQKQDTSNEQLILKLQKYDNQR